MEIHGFFKICQKILICFSLNYASFLPNLTLVSKSLTKFRRNNAVQLECRYIKHLMKYEKVYKIFFICASAHDNQYIFFQDLIVNFMK